MSIAKSIKPVVASFGDVAASGGYYAAAPADVIYSNPYTITGSIGVIAGYPVINRLLEKVDVTSDSIQFLPNAAWNNMEMGLPEGEMEKLRAHIDWTYDQFKRVVSLGRKMTQEEVEEIAQGQIFTGTQAKHLGLVDELGSICDAIRAAAGLSTGRIAKTMQAAGLQELMTDQVKQEFQDALNGGAAIYSTVRQQLLQLPVFQGQPEPTPEQVSDVLSRHNYSIRPLPRPVIIPHVNIANEALGFAISAAFQSEDERSPVPIDQPLIDPNKDNPPTERGRFLIGALLGIARSNDIPIWQFPMFCYWYAAQATAKVGDGGMMMGGWMDAWFGKLFGSQQLLLDTMEYARMFAGGAPPMFTRGKTRFEARMEMPPLQIVF